MKIVIAALVLVMSSFAHAQGTAPCNRVIGDVRDFYDDALNKSQIKKLSDCANIHQICMLSDDVAISANLSHAPFNPDAIVRAGLMQHTTGGRSVCVVAMYSGGWSAEWMFDGWDAAPFGGRLEAISAIHSNIDVMTSAEMVTKFRDISRRFLNQ